MRKPISRVRWETTYDNTPNRPIAPSNNASADATARVSIVNDSRAIESAARRSIVNMRYMGASGAASRTIARISGAICSARRVLTT